MTTKTDDPPVVEVDQFAAMSLPKVREAITEMSTKVSGIFDAHKDGETGFAYDAIPADDVQALQDLNEKLAHARKRYDELQRLAGFAEEADKLAKYMKEPAGLIVPQAVPPQARAKSFGQAFIESDAYKAFIKEKPAAGFTYEFTADNAVLVHEGKAVLGEDDALADVDTQYPPESVRTGVIVDTLYQPNNVGPLIPSITTGSAAVVYMRETVNDQAAVEVGEGALSPEASIEWAEDSSPVRKITVALPQTEELMADEPAIRGIANGRLRVFMNNREDLQILTGDGIAPNLTGILNTAGIGNVDIAAAATAPVLAESVHNAATVIRQAFQEPSAALMNNASWETIRLARDDSGGAGTGGYLVGPIGISGAQVLWGIPLTLNENMQDHGTATNIPVLVGDFRGAANLFRRQGITAAVSDSHEDRFLRGILTIRLTQRLALVIWRPAGFVTVTNT